VTCLAVLEAPETYTSGKARHLNRELSVIVDQLQAATTAWETAAGKLAELEKAG
jgi:ATP-binding cassette subfamily F protein 3